MAERSGARGEAVGFLDFARVGVPITLLTLLWGFLALVLVRG